jgi:hypothetical protein
LFICSWCDCWIVVKYYVIVTVLEAPRPGRKPIQALYKTI